MAPCALLPSAQAGGAVADGVTQGVAPRGNVGGRSY